PLLGGGWEGVDHE
ncbi:hypothetical protein VCHC17A1_0240B, partial [Vibrio cholerae HC-17A1]